MTPLTSSELAAVINYIVTDQRYFSSSVPFAPFRLFFNDIRSMRKVLLMLNDKGFLTYGALSSHIAEELIAKGVNIGEDAVYFEQKVRRLTERIAGALMRFTYAVKTNEDYLKITAQGKAAAHVVHAIQDLSGLLYNNFMKKQVGLEPIYGSPLEAQVNATLLGHPEWTEKEFFDKHVAWVFSAAATSSGMFKFLQKMVIRSLLFDKYLHAT